ncbi:hypothetical protein HYH03_004746 [Edaphochlamys debaryana]|uniref:Rieske domain-containing protein n=1 Tax=Edaphochlamys debaryana TaxID=47281 RepID=A0A836C1P8_9CHLO|nr:hypothetical protein HYH03_004746 [Edaphochlamys debaryana]|eukprot:KAG2497156.1 hypothetical protein HYH03_004746 [Edaphochlamys debaryana]
MRLSGAASGPQLATRRRDARPAAAPRPLPLLRASPALRLAAATQTQTVTSQVDVVGAPAPASEAAGSPASQPAPGSSPDDPFVWTSHWWPLMPVSYLRTDRPTPVTLLGMPLVVWRDGKGAWRVFRDRCPHRMAPLSEGRVEADGTLSCSYHGWRFSGSGACTRIPQALDPAAEAAACSSRRSCATAFPAQEMSGMLWVWPEDSPAAAAAAAATPVIITRRLQGAGRTIAEATEAYDAAKKQGTAKGKPPRQIDWFMRELPYSYEVLVENLLDPAHLPFSHHNINPMLNRSGGGPMPMRTNAPASATTSTATTAPASSEPGPGQAQAQAQTLPQHYPRPSGPDAEFDFVGNISKDGTLAFTAPHLITYTYRLGPGAEMLVELFAIPVAPGRSRFFTVAVPPLPGAPVRRPPMPPLRSLTLKRVASILSFMLDPVVTHHRMMNELLDGDSVFLAIQDELLREIEASVDRGVEAGAGEGAEPPSASTPAPADAEPASRNGGGGAGPWARLYYLPTQADNAVLAARRWLEERAGGGPFRAEQRRRLAGSRPNAAAAAGGSSGGLELIPRGSVVGGAPSREGRQAMLSRLDQHTRHCPACRERLDSIRAVAAAARAVQLPLLVALCVAAGAAGAAAMSSASLAAAGAAAAAAAAVPVWPAVALAVLFGLAWAAAGWVYGTAERMTQQFTFVDYVHAERN